jgi:rfaE bifunctional protein nucleotidyltransferase chain/domain
MQHKIHNDWSALASCLIGKKVVFTNGCFDILHVGHATYLAAAKSLGDVLVVAVNSDDSVARLKGPKRPINTLVDRQLLLAALQSVDYVTQFSDDTPLEIITLLKPQVLVKGGDYSEETVVGREVVKQNGGEVVILALVEGKSSSNVIKKLNSNGND